MSEFMISMEDFLVNDGGFDNNNVLYDKSASRAIFADYASSNEKNNTQDSSSPSEEAEDEFMSADIIHDGPQNEEDIIKQLETG